MQVNALNQYVSYKEGFLNNTEIQNIHEFLSKYNLSGTEVFMDDIVSRDKILFQNDEEKQELINRLNELAVKRLHCSYWAYPTSFLTKNNYKELVSRFGSISEVITYYGDTTGEHIYSRWLQEYELACELGAQTYVFHTIDYAPIDGAWEYTISREKVVNAMISIVQHFTLLLYDKGLLSAASPIIELENAGWGLEYGAQTNDDFKRLFNQLYDPMNKVKIGWDLNHLLHAVGYDEDKEIAYFMLGDNEITSNMVELQNKYENDPKEFASKWVEENILDPEIIGRISSLHLSDCEMKNIKYFQNGRLQGHFKEEIDALESFVDKEDYGVRIVLSKYDSHIPLGQGVLDPDNVRALIDKTSEKSPSVALLHELKNSTSIHSDLEIQLAFLNK